MEKRWKIASPDEDKVTALQKALSINRRLCTLLVDRNIDDYDKAKAYFRPSLAALHDPWLMKDMDKAVQRIELAFDKKEKILVFGDYDVDGTTSVACMFRFLCTIYQPALLDFYIPHRYREGYGVSKMGIDFAAANNFSLIISLDCGIKSVELVAYAKTLGIDFIICDHHLPDDIIPAAVAVLNPKQADCLYPYKDLCGCGVGFKLITALAQQYGIDETFYYCFLDLLATAIAADIVPMTGENRIMAYYGMKRINENPCPGIKALAQLGPVNSDLTITNVVFIIAPRINAAGRMDDARKAVQLFIEPDFEKALVLAGQLQSDNTDRKDADKTITEEALALISGNPLLINKKTSVLYQPHWHKGVVGIVASRLIETYHRPTVVLTLSGEVVAGSARSVPGFNLYEAIHACREHLLGYGGHFAAAGMSLFPASVEAFAEQFEKVVSETIPPELLIPELLIHSELSFKELTLSFYRIICQMEPFGPENMRPVFISRGVTDAGYSKIVKEQHLRFVVQQDGITLTGIGFNLADKFALLANKQKTDIVYTIDENEWNGNKNLQLKVIDLRPAT